MFLQSMPYPASAVSVPPAMIGTPTFASNSSGSGPVNVAYPVGVAANVIAIIQVTLVDSASANSVNTPTGFTLISQQTLFSLADNSSKVATFYRRLDGSESGSVNITCSAGHGGTDTVSAHMSLWGGCLTSGTPYESLAAATSNGAQNVNMASSACTTTGAERTILNFGGTYSQSNASPAAGWTEVYDRADASGTGECGSTLYSKTRAAAGTEAAAIFTLSVSRRWRTITFALIPA